MKKLLAILLALVLMMSVACAEEAPVADAATEATAAAEEAVTRTSTVEVNGVPVELTETLYTAENYTLWYQADKIEAGVLYDNAYFKPVGAAEDDASVYYTITSIEIPAEEAEGMIAEAVGGYDGEWIVGATAELETAAGNKILTVDANNGTEMHCYYLVVGENYSLCITAVYPVADAEEMFTLFDLMTISIELVTAEAEVAE